MDSDAVRWDSRYAEAPLPEPSLPEALVGRTDLEALIPVEGRAVDVACGVGAQSLWLAERGLRVTALDVSARATDLLFRAAQGRELSSRIEARTVDLDVGLPHDVHDLDVLVCQRFRDPRLYGAFVHALRSGGIGVVTVLSSVDLDTTPGPFHAPAGDLADAFDRDDIDLLLDQERGGVASVIFRRR